MSVAPGTILGIVGANGAGKSTLLKIIARVTRPTEGRVVGVGRVVSLLELGAGFNPDFSARDNILMNAAMHGIPRREALDTDGRHLEFAELDDFVDNPLRQYSSGMYLRLAFSVAINMQPDILLADEILAVGDIAFQERCLQRVAEEAERGLTVLFVSHDMAAISRLCHRVIWLDKGQVMRDGIRSAVVDEYEEATLLGQGREAALGEKTGRHANVVAEIASVRLLNSLGEEIGAAPTAEDVFVRVRLKVRKPGAVLRGIIDLYAKRVLAFRTTQREEFVADRPRGRRSARADPCQPAGGDHLHRERHGVHRSGKETKVVLDNALTFMAYGHETGDSSSAAPWRPTSTGRCRAT